MSGNVTTSGHARIVDSLSAIEVLESLDELHGHVIAMTRAMLQDGDDPLVVCDAIAAAHENLTTKLIELAEQRLGTPPCPYVWMALGSHGRGEQVLSSDQDSAIAYRARSDSELAAAGSYFHELASLVVAGLSRAGLPECDGGYMATNWCQPFDHYTSTFRTWVEKPDPAALVRAEVFLDVRAFYGELSTDALDNVLVVGGTRGPFRAQMAKAAVSFKPPIGLFGQLKKKNGGVDVKTGGTAPIVLLARLYALAAGSRARNTADRLAEAASAGTIAERTAVALDEAYRFLTGLRLQHQADQAADDLPIDNIVQVDWLSDEQRKTLRDSLRMVKSVQEVTSTTFATHTLA